MTNKSTTFIRKINLSLETLSIDQILDDFLRDMEYGLQGKPSPLEMFPSFINIANTLPLNKPVIVIDAGGTNLRICTVTFRENDEPLIENFSKHKMPGTDKYISKDDFFNSFAELILPLSHISNHIGFCFSYSVEMQPNRDGKLLYWSKEVKAPEVVGEMIAANILAILNKHNYNPEITILNDTVATLLAGKLVGQKKQYDGFVGMILGTGTNTSYIEDNKNITKIKGLAEDGKQPINVESGKFDKCPRSSIDIKFDKTTMLPETYQFEKMVAGAYRGGLCLTLLNEACSENLFSEKAEKEIASWTELQTWHVTHFMNNEIDDTPFASAAFSDDDIQIIKELFSAIINRAAVFVAINISAAIIKGNSGKSKDTPCCVNVDGSTFHKLNGFKESVTHHLHQILDDKNIHFELVHIDNAPVIGAAVGGLVI